MQPKTFLNKTAPGSMKKRGISCRVLSSREEVLWLQAENLPSVAWKKCLPKSLSFVSEEVLTHDLDFIILLRMQ